MSIRQESESPERSHSVPDQRFLQELLASHARVEPVDPEFRKWLDYLISDQAIANGDVVRHTVSRDVPAHTAAARRYVSFMIETLPRCACGYRGALQDLALDVVYGRFGKAPIVGFRFFRRALWLGKAVDWNEPDDHVEDDDAAG